MGSLPRGFFAFWLFCSGFLCLLTLGVMPALVAGIHALICAATLRGVDGRDRPGRDDVELLC
jgi:hypothetical protein